MRLQGFFVLLGIVAVAVLTFPAGTIPAVYLAFKVWQAC